MLKKILMIVLIPIGLENWGEEND